MRIDEVKVICAKWNTGEGCCDHSVEVALRCQTERIIKKEIEFLEEWLEMYSEGEHRMLVCERDISDRIKDLKTWFHGKVTK